MNKPISRRLFGKAMAAVPLAVSEPPKLAAQSMAIGLANAGMMGASNLANYSPVQMPDEEWKHHRRKELQAIIEGKDDDYERDIRSRAPYVGHHYDSLKSLSPGMRAVLFHRENGRRARLERISSAQRELSNLVRKFF